MNNEALPKLRVTGPDEYGSIYVYFQDKELVTGAVARTLTHGPNVNIDYDKDGNLFGIEILGVAEKI